MTWTVQLLAVVAAVTAQAGNGTTLPSQRVMLVSCRGVDGPWSILVRATPRAKAQELAWDMAVDALRDRQVVPPFAATVLAPVDMDVPPASAGLSWANLDDGSQRVWSPQFSVLVPPSRDGKSRGTLSAVTVESGAGPCTGAVLANGGSVRLPARGESVLLLVLPFDSTSAAVMPDGVVATTPLLAVEPPGPRGKKPLVAPVTGLTRGDERARLDRVDVRWDPQQKRAVGTAWRVTMFPSRAVGLLTSQAVLVPAPGVLMHQVTGTMQAGPLRGRVHGLLLEGVHASP